MALVGAEFKNPLKGIALIVIGVIVLACGAVSADEGLKQGIARNDGSMEISESGYLTKTISLLLRNVETPFEHVWPVRFFICLLLYFPSFESCQIV